MELLEKQSIIKKPEETQAGMVRLKVTQDKYDFPSNKWCFRCGSLTHLANKCNIGKGQDCQNYSKAGHYAVVCKSKAQKLPVHLLQNESSFNEEYCFTNNNPLTAIGVPNWQW